jgi:hypothetical protein
MIGGPIARQRECAQIKSEWRFAELVKAKIYLRAIL